MDDGYNNYVQTTESKSQTCNLQFSSGSFGFPKKSIEFQKNNAVELTSTVIPNILKYKILEDMCPVL